MEGSVPEFGLYSEIHGRSLLPPPLALSNPARSFPTTICSGNHPGPPPCIFEGGVTIEKPGAPNEIGLFLRSDPMKTPSTARDKPSNLLWLPTVPGEQEAPQSEQTQDARFGHGWCSGNGKLKVTICGQGPG